MLHAIESDYGCVPVEIVVDGGYASQNNVENVREKSGDRIVFKKPGGLGYHEMGVKKKTFDRLKTIRFGIEGNRSELKRAFGLSKDIWKSHDEFCAYFWSSVLSYSLECEA